MKYMKYRVGDRVRIKTWNDMVREYSSTTQFERNYIFIQSPRGSFVFNFNMEEMLNNFISDRIITIKEIRENYHQNNSYKIEESTLDFYWQDWMIERLVERTEPDPINSRFEILDL